MRNLKSIATIAIASAVALAPVGALALTGVWNTGPSTNEATKGSSLDLEFGPCADKPERFCGTVIRVREPNGPSGEDTLPDGSPILGYTVVTSLKDKGEGKFKRGKILAVDESMVDGEMKWYGLRIQNHFDGTLTATGCLGFICPRDMTWYEVKDGEPLPYEAAPVEASPPTEKTVNEETVDEETTGDEAAADVLANDE